MAKRTSKYLSSLVDNLNAEIESKKSKTDSDKTDINKKLAIEALQKTAGNVSAACKSVNINRQRFYEWMEEDHVFAKAVEDVKESLIDMAESALYKQITEGNTTAVIFYLKTQGKRRGYTEGIELSGKDGVALIPQQKTIEILFRDRPTENQGKEDSPTGGE